VIRALDPLNWHDIEARLPDCKSTFGVGTQDNDHPANLNRFAFAKHDTFSNLRFEVFDQPLDVRTRCGIQPNRNVRVSVFFELCAVFLHQYCLASDPASRGAGTGKWRADVHGPKLSPSAGRRLTTGAGVAAGRWPLFNALDSGRGGLPCTKESRKALTCFSTT